MTEAIVTVEDWAFFISFPRAMKTVAGIVADIA
jgi:hypothetical protein